MAPRKDGAMSSWDRVELFRWQYNELPKPDDTRKLDVSKALYKMGWALREFLPEKGPNISNTAGVLIYAGELIKDYESQLAKKDEMLRVAEEYLEKIALSAGYFMSTGESDPDHPLQLAREALEKLK
jgi:hypothetical protein